MEYLVNQLHHEVMPNSLEEFHQHDLASSDRKL